MQILYTASATASGGGRENGLSKTDDGRLEVSLSMPREMGGSGGKGTNPEQLLAAGYAACFLNAMRFVAGKDKIELPADASVSADVGFGKRDDGDGFAFSIALRANVPGMEIETARDIMARAHIVCPYSHATKGNVDVSLDLD